MNGFDTIVSYEAEGLTLTNYGVEQNILSSGGAHIFANGGTNPGVAEGIFNGEAGVYEVNIVYYDENDGLSTLDVTVAGDTQSFVFDKDLGFSGPVSGNLTERVTHSAITLQQGDTFRIEGQSNNGEPGRVDRIEFILQEPQPQDVFYEAESLTRTNYNLENNAVSSGGQHVSLIGSNANSGTVTGTFNGERGIYEVKLNYYDENDGVSSASVTVAGDTQNFMWNQNLGSAGATAATLTETITHSAIMLDDGDTFEVTVVGDSGEAARVDSIEFNALDNAPATIGYEVEDLDLINYQVESYTLSSGNEHVSLSGSGANSGIARGNFNGTRGIYKVTVGYYDENDGVSPASVTVAGDIFNFSFDENLNAGGVSGVNLTERVTHQAILLKPGDDFEIEGQSDNGEAARFDYIKFEFVEAAPEAVVSYEAEDLTLTNYVIESNPISSGGEHVSLVGSGASSGTVTGTFDGEAGNYQVKLSYYDENDGKSDARVTVAGDIQSFEWNQNLGSAGATAASLTERITHSNIALQQGDTFEVFVEGDGGEPARFDKIEFIRIESQPPTTYYVSPNGNDNNPGTSDQPWKTINYAVSKFSSVKAGDTILVKPGTYTELITLDKSGSADLGHITLKADGQGQVILKDPNPVVGDFKEGVIQSANRGYWIIDGFRIENTSWAGISLRNANNMIVQNNHTFETGASGIIVMPDNFFGGGEAEVTSKDIKVLNNTIERANWRWTGTGAIGLQEALSIWGVDGFEVAHNLLKEGTREGIDAKTGSRNGTIHSNTVTGVASISGTNAGYNGGPAIYVEGSRSDVFNIDVYNNIVYNNFADGIVIADEETEIGEGDVKDIRVYNNLVYGNGIVGQNGGAGIMVTSNVNDVEIINNTVVGNVQSIFIDGTFYNGYKAFDILVRNNIFANPAFQNGFIKEANDLVLDNNLFTNQFNLLYEGGTGLNNLTQTNNSQIASIGLVNSQANNLQLSSTRSVNLQASDFELSSTSAAIDAGSTLIPNYASIDKNGITRDKDGDGDGNGEPDIGAYEYLV